MALKWTPEGYLEYGIGCLSGPKKAKEKGSTFTPLYNGIKDSYGVDSIGYYWVIGVPKGHTTLAGDTKVLRVPSIYNVSVGFIYRKHLSSVS